MGRRRLVGADKHLLAGGAAGRGRVPVPPPAGGPVALDGSRGLLLPPWR